jgi:protein-S-isoprenylcysteine O-methyltransferase Ste14
MSMDRPGVKTSEFWVTVAAMILSVLVAFNVLSDDMADSLQAALPQLIEVVFLILGIVGPALGYKWSRTRVKQASLSGS